MKGMAQAEGDEVCQGCLLDHNLVYLFSYCGTRQYMSNISQILVSILWTGCASLCLCCCCFLADVCFHGSCGVHCGVCSLQRYNRWHQSMKRRYVHPYKW